MTEFIRLDQFLKREGLVGTGGEGKVRIQSGDVTVNDEIETQRGRKLRTGDRVGIDDTVREVVLGTGEAN